MTSGTILIIEGTFFKYGLRLTALNAEKAFHHTMAVAQKFESSPSCPPDLAAVDGRQVEIDNGKLVYRKGLKIAPQCS